MKWSAYLAFVLTILALACEILYNLYPAFLIGLVAAGALVMAWRSYPRYRLNKITLIILIIGFLIPQVGVFFLFSGF